MAKGRDRFVEAVRKERDAVNLALDQTKRSGVRLISKSDFGHAPAELRGSDASGSPLGWLIEHGPTREASASVERLVAVWARVAETDALLRAFSQDAQALAAEADRAIDRYEAAAAEMVTAVAAVVTLAPGAVDYRGEPPEAGMLAGGMVFTVDEDALRDLPTSGSTRSQLIHRMRELAATAKALQRAAIAYRSLHRSIRALSKRNERLRADIPVVAAEFQTAWRELLETAAATTARTPPQEAEATAL